MKREILLLGDQRLYDVSREINREDLSEVLEIVQDLHDTLMAFRHEYGVGRAIAAPQIGAFKRLIYMHIENPKIIINPALIFEDEEKMEVLDDCMSFPMLLVRVERYKRCKLEYRNENWELCLEELEGDLSELIQHEYDHLDGILATMRAKSTMDFVYKKK
ncbi:peptide deformylase [Fusibacter bizertensis]|jgi:N-formylmethionyl-tRNA deformylase|uniref:Peptide deformylase n=1 Tax=Fusibacter bizertensis TaxID=1488331 RepID=A0ABT6NBP0_9FIRM|nr:peptide deformylase [Fusibacter bizertensis]MDH8677840.1 peptide deformylase [Fusibacter bizertensis]